MLFAPQRVLADEFHKFNESKVLSTVPSGHAGIFEDDVLFQEILEI